MPDSEAWPSRDEIAQAVKHLWTGDPRQHTEIVTKVLREIRNTRGHTHEKT